MLMSLYICLLFLLKDCYEVGIPAEHISPGFYFISNSNIALN